MNCTTIEQSKALIEAGLNPDSADMCWIKDNGLSENKYPQAVPWKDNIVKEFYAPCWSTGALLNLMPPYLFEFSRGIDLNVYKNVSNGRWVISYLPNNIESMQNDKFRQFFFGENLIDAACDMVLWLLKNGFIKKVEK